MSLIPESNRCVVDFNRKLTIDEIMECFEAESARVRNEEKFLHDIFWTNFLKRVNCKTIEEFHDKYVNSPAKP